MTLDQLVAAAPASLAPVVKLYGPALLKMSADEVWAWINLLVTGQTRAALASIMARLDNADLAGQWNQVNTDWAAANADNARKIKLEQEAALAICQALLGAALAMVGL